MAEGGKKSVQFLNLFIILLNLTFPPDGFYFFLSFACFYRHNGINGYSHLRSDWRLTLAEDERIVKVKEGGNAVVTHGVTQGGYGGSGVHKQHTTHTTNLGCMFVFRSSHKS